MNSLSDTGCWSAMQSASALKGLPKAVRIDFAKEILTKRITNGGGLLTILHKVLTTLPPSERGEFFNEAMDILTSDGKLALSSEDYAISGWACGNLQRNFKINVKHMQKILPLLPLPARNAAADFVIGQLKKNLKNNYFG